MLERDQKGALSWSALMSSCVSVALQYQVEFFASVQYSLSLYLILVRNFSSRLLWRSKQD